MTRGRIQQRVVQISGAFRINLLSVVALWEKERDFWLFSTETLDYTGSGNCFEKTRPRNDLGKDERDALLWNTNAI